MDHKKLPPLENSIKRQLDTNAAKNLLYEHTEQIMDVEPSFLAALEELLASTETQKGEGFSFRMVSFAAQALLKKVYAANQYLNIPEQKVAELEEIYRHTWQVMVDTRDIHTALRQFHYPALSQWLATLYPEEFRNRLRFSPTVGRVVYAEYSAELQLELLHIDVATLQQPVLDIGCGSQANLVTHLRTLGIDAYGFDRSLEIHAPYLEQIDWFEYSFKPTQWGTIISNMAFTNHLNYAHLHDISQLEPYLLKLRDILESLVASGRFYYAPSLPFVEDRFSRTHYQITRQKVVSDIFASVVVKKS